MAKDPAVLWYTSDFLSGTILFTDEQVGQYCRLLCHQHQLGHLPEQHMLNICKTHDSLVWKKFTKDENGFWYQHRMELEIKKRASYCESRRSNKMKEYDKPKHMSKHMSGHMEDEDEDGNRIKDGSEKSPEKEGIVKGRGEPPTWQDSFEIYRTEEMEAYQKLMADVSWLSKRQEFHPNLNLKKSIEKAHVDFWCGEVGWKHKKKSKSKNIDWRRTYENALTMRANQVYKTREEMEKTISEPLKIGAVNYH